MSWHLFLAYITLKKRLWRSYNRSKDFRNPKLQQMSRQDNIWIYEAPQRNRCATLEWRAMTFVGHKQTNPMSRSVGVAQTYKKRFRRRTLLVFSGKSALPLMSQDDLLCLCIDDRGVISGSWMNLDKGLLQFLCEIAQCFASLFAVRACIFGVFFIPSNHKIKMVRALPNALETYWKEEP